jgi:hypothetical protein
MIRVSIPGWNTLELSYLVLELNGTIATLRRQGWKPQNAWASIPWPSTCP